MARRATKKEFNTKVMFKVPDHSLEPKVPKGAYAVIDDLWKDTKDLKPGDIFVGLLPHNDEAFAFQVGQRAGKLVGIVDEDHKVYDMADIKVMGKVKKCFWNL